MNEKLAKSLLISINVIVLMCGIAMFVGGILLEYTTNGRYILQTLNSNITSSQLGAIGVVLISIGAMLVLVSFVGCCGSVYESTCLLTLFFFFVLILFLCQAGLVIASFVFGFSKFEEKINDQLSIYVRGYNISSSETEMAIVDTVQQFFDCCGYNGPNDYNSSARNPQSTTTIARSNGTTIAPSNGSTIAPSNGSTITPSNAASTMSTANETFFSGKWPKSCCNGVNDELCVDYSLPKSQLEKYLNIQGCTASIDAWVQSNLKIIGGIGAGIAVIQLFAMFLACSLRSSLD